MPRVTYFMICLLLIGLYWSCGVADDGGTTPSKNYDPLGISSFSVVDGNDVPISDTNAIPLNTSFLLTFDQSLGTMADHTSYLKGQIKLIDMEGSLIDLSVDPTQITNQIKIAPTTNLSYHTTYQLTVKKGLTIGNYRVTNDITYSVTTKKNSDSSLIVIYNDETISPNGNNITILFKGTDVSSVMFTLEVGEGATLQDDNNKDLILNENRQYTTNMDFSGNATHNFTVTAQDGTTSTTYTIRVSQQQTDSKEILSFAFLETDNSLLAADIAMDIDPNSRAITKTVTNVEGITGLIPTIAHSGSDIFPASGVAQDFSTNNTYTVTATNNTTSDYTVTLTSYYGAIFNANGGLISGDPTVTEYILYGEKVPPPSDPSREHYGFEGWYDASSGGSIFDFTTTDITTQTTAYAQWTNKQYKVSFDTDGGSTINPVIVNSLTPVAKPADPITNHYVLEDWYIDSSFTARYDFNRVVSNDLTLYAKYIHKQYQVRFYRGTDLLDTILLTSLATISVSDYPVNPNAGGAYRWHSNVSLGGVFNKDSLVVADFDLYAEEVPASFEMIIENRIMPTDLTHYGEISEEVFSNYTPGATVTVRYVKKSGTGDGSSWANAANDIKAMIDGINDASENKVYVIMVASGTYKPSSSYVMKNHIALVGGFITDSYDRLGETFLDGNNDKRVFDNNDLDRTALFYGVVVTNGSAGIGGGMWNVNSSPTLKNVTFSGNTADNGGGMYNDNFSSPTLINVTFSGNTADNNGNGGGMRNNDNSSPTLINVTFSGNTADNGGGMDNNNSSSPTLINVTFSGNTADNNGNGGGMRNNDNSSPTLKNVTFSDNRANLNGGGIYNDNFSSPTLINVTFSDNTVDNNGNGGGIYNLDSSSVLINVTFFENLVDSGVGGGVYHDGNGQPLTLINTILWGNNKGQVYLNNNNSDTETMNLYYSRISDGLNASTITSGIRLESGDTIIYPVAINSEGVIADVPGLDNLADNGGEVNTISIGNNSPAKDQGIYVRGVKAGNTYSEADLYYSIDNTDWYSDLGLTTQESPPNNADDLTATDARGYGRVGRPDMGAYEVGGTAP